MIESPLYRMLNGHIYDKTPKYIGYDDTGNKIEPFGYLVIGETLVTDEYKSGGHVEQISLTCHLFYRDNPENLSSTDEVNHLMKWLKYYLEIKPKLQNYKCSKVRVEAQKVFTDIDKETSHGVLTVNYTIKHNVLFKESEVNGSR